VRCSLLLIIRQRVANAFSHARECLTNSLIVTTTHRISHEPMSALNVLRTHVVSRTLIECLTNLLLMPPIIGTHELLSRLIESLTDSLQQIIESLTNSLLRIVGSPSIRLLLIIRITSLANLLIITNNYSRTHSLSRTIIESPTNPLLQITNRRISHEPIVGAPFASVEEFNTHHPATRCESTSPRP